MNLIFVYSFWFASVFAWVVAYKCYTIHFVPMYLSIILLFFSAFSQSHKFVRSMLLLLIVQRSSKSIFLAPNIAAFCCFDFESRVVLFFFLIRYFCCSVFLFCYSIPFSFISKYFILFALRDDGTLYFPSLLCTLPLFRAFICVYHA